MVSWLATCVNDFGASRLPLSSLVDFTKSLMDNTNPKIRAGAINLLGALYKQTGRSIIKSNWSLSCECAGQLSILLFQYLTSDNPRSTVERVGADG